MALNRKIAVVAFDKQTSFGVLAANRKYGFGVRGGSILSVGLEQAYEELTLLNRQPPSAYRTAFLHTVDCTTRAWARSSAMLFENALGARVTTGASDPFTHTLTYANVPGYLTMATRLDSEYHKIRDSRVDQLGFTWNQAEPIEMSLRTMGTIWTGYTASGDPSTDESGDQSFYPAGGTFELDTDSSTPVLADITGGSITIQNHLEPVRVSRATEPIDVWPGLFEVGVTLRLIPANTNDWRAAITGSPSGTAVSNAPIYGSMHTKWIWQTSPERSIEITIPRISFSGDYPEPDPAGGPVEIELSGTLVKAAAGESITVLVKNQDAASNYAGS